MTGRRESATHRSRSRALLSSSLIAVVTLSPFVRDIEAREPGEFVRADANYTGTVDLSDVVTLLGFLFRGGPEPFCTPIADANGTGEADVSDAVYLLGYLFRGGPAPTPLSEEETAICENVRATECGEDLFAGVDPLGNGFACAHCHSKSSPAQEALDSDGIIFAGHGLGDVLHRPTYFNGQIADIETAVNRCRQDWMQLSELESDSQEMHDLLFYIDGFSDNDDPASAISFDIVPPATSGPSAGDPETGCELFARACQTCHGPHAEGIDGLAPSLWNETITPDVIREHVRLSGPTVDTVPSTLYEGLLGTPMPFFSRQRLGDVDLEHISSYVMQIQVPRRRNCERVNSTLELLRGGPFRTFDHGVRGTAEHWSDGRIVLRDFFYDGQGPELVLVWLYDKDETVDSILSGIAISGHIARETPYIDTELTFTIPGDVNDRDFNTVAIWCTLYDQNYGEAFLFE